MRGRERGRERERGRIGKIGREERHGKGWGIGSRRIGVRRGQLMEENGECEPQVNYEHLHAV